MISPGLSSCEHSLNTLRYADRVKELAVNENPDTIKSNNAKQESADDQMADEEDDLAQLRSLNVRFGYNSIYL